MFFAFLPATRNSLLVLLFLLTFVTALYGSLEDDIPRQTRRTQCGRLLAVLTGECGSFKHSVLNTCCQALRVWNEDHCWCDANAFSAASNLAMDYYALIFRARVCNITTIHHPRLTLPNSEKSTLDSTCAHSQAENAAVTSNSVEKRSKRERLRIAREDVLYWLAGNDIENEDDVTSFSNIVDSVFTPEALLFSIGLSFSYPRLNVKRYLLKRSSLLGGPLWKAEIEKDTVLWTSDRTVSYAASLSISSLSYSKIEFVTFEKNSPRIAAIYSQEEEAVRLLRQFVYIDASDRALWNVQRSVRKLCMDILSVCPGDTGPFRSIKQCERAYASISPGKVTCSKLAQHTSLIALHGNTVSCKDMFVALSSLRSGAFCEFVGRPGLGVCREHACAVNSYDNAFDEEANPRFDSSGGFTCSTDGCIENWPYVEASD